MRRRTLLWLYAAKPFARFTIEDVSLALPAVSNALVGDVPDIVGVDTLGSAALIVNRLMRSDIHLKETADLRQ